jgi:hypothetical protein
MPTTYFLCNVTLLILFIPVLTLGYLDHALHSVFCSAMAVAIFGLISVLEKKIFGLISVFTW